MSNTTEFEDDVSSFNSSKDHSIGNILNSYQMGLKMRVVRVVERVYNTSVGTTNMRRHIPKCFDPDELGPPKKVPH